MGSHIRGDVLLGKTKVEVDQVPKDLQPLNVTLIRLGRERGTEEAGTQSEELTEIHRAKRQ